MSSYSVFPIQPRPGILPSGDSINLGENQGVTPTWVEGDKVRFVEGWPQSFQGTFANTDPADPILGVIRTYKYFNIAGVSWYLLGSTLGLWAQSSTTVTNITPLKTGSTAIANSIATQFVTLGSNPLATTSGLAKVVITHTAHGLRTDDLIIIAGVSGTFNNIPDTEINGPHFITFINANSYSIGTATLANATGSGGGGSVTVGTCALTITHAAHGFLAGQRVKISGAADTGGILAANINKEFVIRSVTTNTYTVFASIYASSAVTGGGGASTVDYGQIDVSDGADFPTVWSMDKLDNKIILCPGNARGIYQWLGSTATAPTLVTNAPTQANWIFVHYGKIVALGAYSATDSNQKDNRIMNSRTGDYTNWTVAVGFDAYEDIKEDADRFICNASVGDRVYLFTETQIFAFDDVGGDDIWVFKLLSRTSGVVAANAVYEVDGIVYFMGPSDIYRINGGIIEGLVPGHALNAYSLFVSGDGVALPVRKGFIAYLRKYNELYFQMPYRGTYISFSLKEAWWTFGGTMNRTAMMSNHPVNYYGINSSNVIYVHNDNGPNWSTQWDASDTNAYCLSNWRSLDSGKSRALLRGLEIAGQFFSGIKISVDYKDHFLSDDAGSWLTYGPTTVTYTGPGRLSYQIKCTYWRYKFQMSAGSYAMRISGFKELVQKSGAAHGSYANYA